jgi:hypothetical protein
MSCLPVAKEVTDYFYCRSPVSPYFGHIVERAWPLMAHCYSPQLYHDCAKYWWADNANGGCVCSDVKG